MILRRFGPRILLAIAGMALAVAMAEIYLRVTGQETVFDAWRELKWMRNNPRDLQQSFTLDPDFGFRPILGTGLYTEYGTLVTESARPVRRPGVKRLLFIGDSVTARGRLVAAIKDLYGTELYEYWNAGVESFNTRQEVEYYLKYNAALEPDHVVLTFVLNDFQITPVCFKDDRGRMVVYAPDRSLHRIDRWLFEKSRLYRLLVGLSLSGHGAARGQEQRTDVESEMATGPEDTSDVAPETGREPGPETGDETGREIRESLGRLRCELDRRGAALTVLVLPVLQPYEEWDPLLRERRDTVLRILRELDIRHFDLLEPLQQALAANQRVQARPDDIWHPNSLVCRAFAGYLQERGLF